MRIGRTLRLPEVQKSAWRLLPPAHLNICELDAAAISSLAGHDRHREWRSEEYPGIPLAFKSLATCMRKYARARVELSSRRANRAAMAEDVMAKVIEFYIPDSFSKRVTKVACTEPGKVIEFRSRHGRGLVMLSRDPAAPDLDAKEGASMWTFSS